MMNNFGILILCKDVVLLNIYKLLGLDISKYEYVLLMTFSTI